MAKKLNASQAFDDKWNSEKDLENELEVSYFIYCKDTFPNILVFAAKTNQKRLRWRQWAMVGLVGMVNMLANM